MKISLTILSIILFTFCAFPSRAQKSFTEGMLAYNISISSDKDETPITNSLNGATLSIFLNSAQSRTEMSSTLGTETTVFDIRKSSGYILKEYSGQKLMITMDKGNWTDKNKLYENLNFTTSNELVSIAGYKCKRATARLADGKTFIVYYHPEITLVNKTYNNAFPQLNGLPVQYELQSGNLNFRYTLSNVVAENIPPSRFEAPKSGFRIMTYEENQQLKRN